MEKAAARICREAAVRTNVFVRDLELGVVGVLDGRRLEVVADGFPLCNGAQLAIDTTLVSPIHQDPEGMITLGETKRRRSPSWLGEVAE